MTRAHAKATAKAQAHQTRIDSLWDFDDPAESERRFTDAARSERGLDGEILTTQIARAIGLQSRFDEARALLDELPDDEDEELRVRVLLERGRLLNSGGDPRRAKPEFEMAFGAASDAGLEFLAIDALHMLAIIAAPADQDGLNRRALELAAGAADPRARQWRASLLNNLGWSAFDRGELSAAMALFEDALAARLEHGRESDIIVARWCIGRTLRELGRASDALALQLQLADQLRATGRTDQYVDEEIAACRAALGEGDASGAAGSVLNQDDPTAS